MGANGWMIEVVGAKEAAAGSYCGSRAVAAGMAWVFGEVAERGFGGLGAVSTCRFGGRGRQC